jgi:hypothetical protein
MHTLARAPLTILALLLAAGCTAAPAASSPEVPACAVTEAVWARPPADAAVLDEPAYGDYFVNADRSIWASAWWAVGEGGPSALSEDGIKVGWFRPEGADLAITGQRLDAEAPPLEAHVPCCYPTRFQATGLTFPSEGCWEITATAADRALSFVVLLAPQPAGAR